MCVYAYLSVCTPHKCRYLRKLESDLGSSGTGDRDSCEISDVDAGNQTQVLY